MTIKQKSTEVQGNKVEGYEISCSSCPMTNFLVSRKHLPSQVVTKKFHERRWEVNTRGDDVCPACIEKRRHKLARTRQARNERSVTPLVERLELNSSVLGKVLAEAGFPGTQVIELQGKVPKFKVVLSGGQLSVGRLLHAERELVQKFDATLHTSYLQPELTHVNGGNTVSVSAQFHWIIALEKKFHEPISAPIEEPEEVQL